MILHGSIERFDLGSVLQFLAQNAATGVLEIRDFEEHGVIYLVKGRLEAISLPLTDDRLGVHLIKIGVLNEAQLTPGAHGGRGRLRGGKQAEAARPAPRREGLHERGDNPAGDVPPDDGPHVRDRSLAQRRLHLQRARRDAGVPDIHLWRRAGVASPDSGAHRSWRAAAQEGDAEQDDLCYGCQATDCSPAIKMKYLKQDLCLWRKMSSVPDVRDEPRGDAAFAGPADPGAGRPSTGRGSSSNLRVEHQLPQHFA